MSNIEEDAETLKQGWIRHHESMDEKVRRKLSCGQDPRFLVLSCSDSRVDVEEIFSIRGRGNIFQIRNVGGLFSQDAKAGFAFALESLDPDAIIILHHTRCAGYNAVDKPEISQDVKNHLKKNKCYQARDNVDAFLGKNGDVSPGFRRRLIVEEGARIQAARILSYIKNRNEKALNDILEHRICVIAAVYDMEADDIYLVPKKMRDKTPRDRPSLFKCDTQKIAGFTGQMKPKK